MAGSSSPSKRKGVSGAQNAKHQPYRLVGGDHDHPRFFQTEMNMARGVRPSDFRQTAIYATGIQGGILAKLVFGQPLTTEEAALIGRNK